MKKITLFLFLILSAAATFAQSFSGPTSANSGDIITLTGVGEKTQGFGQTGYEFNAVTSIDNGRNVVTAPAGAQWSFGNFTVTQVTNVYGSSHTPTTIKVKVINNINVAITAKFYIQCTYVSGTTSTSTYIPYTITVNAPYVPPVTVPNDAQSKVFTKNNCGPGYVGSAVTVTVPQGQFLAPTKAEANQQAIAYLNANGQNQANASASGTCLTAIFVRVEFLDKWDRQIDHTVPNPNSSTGYYVDGTISQIFANVTIKVYSNAACTTPLIVTSPLTVNMVQTSTYGGAPYSTSYTIPAGSASYSISNNSNNTIVESREDTETVYEDNIFNWDVAANGTAYVAKTTVR